MPASRDDPRREPAPPSDVTLVLKRLSHGQLSEAEGSDQLLALVYDELRRLASSMLGGERQDHTLQPTALVHEAWMKLIDQSEVEWTDKAHFFAIAAQAMRRILVDHARSKGREKRGGRWERVELDVAWAGQEEDVDLVELDRALTQLSEASPRRAQVVELRFFGGLEMTMIAEVLGTSLRTVAREWRFARAWLLNALSEET